MRPPVLSHTRRGRPEDDHTRQQCKPLWVQGGFAAWITSARLHAHGVEPGVPDIILMHTTLGIHAYHEVKLPGGRQTKEQYDFLLHCQNTGTPMVLGRVDEQQDFLVWLGLALWERAGPLATDARGVFRWRERRYWPSPTHLQASRIVRSWYETPQFTRALARFGWKYATTSRMKG